MKARVKATGEIVEVIRRIIQGRDLLEYVWHCRTDNRCFKEYELEFTTSDIPDNTDYWEKLKHQYAGMAMQGILSSDKIVGILGIQKGKELDAMISNMSVKIATSLINRLKEEEK